MLSHRLPTVEEIDKIAAVRDPAVRNLRITQAYYELSAAFADRTGLGANWCTFATWASKQAGQTIRREDLVRTLEAQLNMEPEVEQLVRELIVVVSRLGAKLSIVAIRESVWHTLLSAAVERSSDAVARGNRKVFEEIAHEFARFMALCGSDLEPNPEHLAQFCRELRPGNPPDGQQYLRQAFTRYYQIFFETDSQTRAELLLLANLEVGFHEQTRLQPEIAESLDVVSIDAEKLKERLMAIFFPSGSWLTRLRLFFLNMFGQTTPLTKALDALVARMRRQLHTLITAQLMTLSLPPDVRLRLGHDLLIDFPDLFRKLTNPDLLALLKQIDPTPDSVRESGAFDWADLPDRLHFIADLFRCYHTSSPLFNAPFTPEQVAVMKAGYVPEGDL